MDLKELARLGAEARIKELEFQIAELRRFVAALGVSDSASSKPRRTRAVIRVHRRRPKTAAEKAAISDRMKAYWAKRKRASR